MTEQNPWKKISTSEVYSNPWITVREDQVIRPNGTPGIYGVVESRAATAVLAITENQEIYLVGQYRYPTDCYSWEIIEGGAEADELPIEAAKRELREEAGLIAKKFELFGPEVHLSNCHSSEVGYIYLATDLTQVPAEPDATELLELRKVKISEALKMVDSGEIKDTLSIVALLRYARARQL